MKMKAKWHQNVAAWRPRKYHNRMALYRRIDNQLA
jgi:hypothetical protein